MSAFFPSKADASAQKAFAAVADLADASIFYQTLDELLSLLQQEPLSPRSLYQSEYWKPETLTEAIEAGLV